MDAAKLQHKKLALLIGLPLLISVGAEAQTFNLSSSSVTLSGNQPTAVSVNSSGAPISFTTATAYTPGDPQWLCTNNSLSPLMLTTPTSLNFIICGSVGTFTGTHTASVTLTSNDGSGARATINVSYTAGSVPSGGGGSGLTSSSNPVFASVQAGNQVSLSFTLTTGSSSAIDYSIEMPSVGWFTVGPATGTVSSSAPATLIATFNAFNLSVGSYSTNLIVDYSQATQKLSIPVQFTVTSASGGTGGGGGNTTAGSLTLSQSSAAWTYSTNGTVPQAATVSVSSSGSNVNFSATAISGGQWLLVNNQIFPSGTLPATLTISPSSTIGSLNTGSYTGVVSIDGSDGSHASFVVTLTVNGGATGLTISPTPINITATPSGSPAQQNVTVTSATGGPVMVTVQGFGQSYQLANQNASANNPVTVTVIGDPTGLGSGTYEGVLTVSVGGVTQTAQINFVVGSGNGSGTGGNGGTGTSGVVTPTSLTFAYQTGSSQPATQSQLVFVFGSGSYTTTVSQGSTSTNWLSVTPSGGTAPAQVNISANATGLVAGTYQGSVVFSTAIGSQTVTVTLTVSASAVLYTTPESILFTFDASASPTIPAQALYVYSSDGSSVTAPSATVNNSSQASWLTAVAGGSNLITVNASPTNLANGVYSASITVTSGSGTATVPVLLIITGAAAAQPLTLSAQSLTFNAQLNGAAPASQTLSVTAPTAPTFTVATSNVGCNGTWLSVTPSGTLTTNNTLTVFANQSGLPVGNCTGNIVLTSNGVPQTVTVTLQVSSGGAAGGTVTVTANGDTSNTSPSLTFTTPSGGGNPASQFLTITSASGAAGVPFTATAAVQTPSGGSWLSLGANSATTPVNQLAVQVNLTGLAPGTYNGSITITPTGGAVVTVPVALTVAGQPTISAPATPLTFSFTAGGQPPANQTIQVTANNGTGLGFTATASSTGGWLSVTPASGNTPTSPAGPATLTVAVNPASLNAGTYNGTITVAGSGSATGNAVINVTLTVTAPLPTITTVVNGATFQTGPVAPGEIVTIGGTSIGPAAPAGLTLTSSGTVATTLSGVQVLFNGIPAPLTYVSATQINAVVPYEIAGILNPTVFVNFLGQNSNGFSLSRTTTSPGIFAQNGQGNGPGAILNQDYSVNGSNNPAAKGSVVSVYLTGEGQTNPAGRTGSVTTATTISQIPVPLLPIAVLINNQPASYTFAGEAPGFVAGVLQLNVQIPANAPSGALPIVINIGGNASQSGITVSVQ